MSALKDLSDAATPGLWYTVDMPWGDGTWIVAGNPDPHAGTMVCDCQDMNESRPEDGPTAQDDAAFIAALVTAYRSGQLARASDAEHYMRLASEKSDRIRELEAQVAFWIECTGRAVDALDECAGDHEEGWDRQQHAENAAAQIRAKYQNR